ncbi:three prime repair exonuclease 2-like [Petromyzon marinus]|uniref:three prime repair exonuclease 2-like n=1 Tax=Petromyzon marinus TaxID=7757 RepID=UPI003F725EFF
MGDAAAFESGGPAGSEPGGPGSGPPQTFVFMDAEATGVARDRPRITELCLVATDRFALENVSYGPGGLPRPPRVRDKLTFCLDPSKLVSNTAYQLTGLSNEKLAENRRREFDGDAVALVSGFLARQTPPVCLVAHNGIQFDFPLLKVEFFRVGASLPAATLCADTLPALRSIMASNTAWQPPCGAAKPGGPPGGRARKRKLRADGGEVAGALSDEAIQEVVAAGGVKFGLSDLYELFFGRGPPAGLHNAETDALTLLRLAQRRAPQLLPWIDGHARPLADIPLLYVPSPSKRKPARAAAVAAAAAAAAAAPAV